jgi:hypothetical protein
MLYWAKSTTNWIIDSSRPLHDHTAPAHEHIPIPFWKLLIIFDMLTLHPRPLHIHTAPSKVVRQPLAVLQQGHLQLLYELSQKPPAPQLIPTTTTPNINYAAQLAADEDNYHTAYARITKAMPAAI